jgi:23S rRNA (guanine745-N1)-methyltransferase
MRPDLLRHLRCPVCSGRLRAAGQQLRCERGHSFDVARQGYVHLAAGPLRHPGDTAAMVAARAEFLAAGHYAFIASALAAWAELESGLVLDVGAGTGYHLAAVLSAAPDAVGLALDSAKPAVRRAARAHPRAGAAVCDAWGRLPVADRAAQLILNVFAPRHAAEFHRVLAPGGKLLVVTPEPEHLAGLVDALALLRVDPSKEDRVAAELGTHFVPAGHRVLRQRMYLTHREVATLVGMGPSARHTDAGELAARIATLPEPVQVTAGVRLARYRPRG